VATVITKALSSNNKGFMANAYHWLKRVPVFPLLLLMPLIIFGIFGPLLYPHDPSTPNLTMTLRPPGWLPGGDWSYFLGTDQLGRDLFSRIIEGARASLLVGIFGVFFSGIIGVSLGLISGYFGGKTDNVIMRIVDTWMAIPGVFFMLMLVAVLRVAGVQGLLPIIFSISVSMWVPYARMVRGETLSLKQREFVALAKVTGCKNSRIIRKHIFPGVINTIVVMATTQLGGAIMAEAGLSFLGVGVQPPNTAWGLLISESGTYMSSAWWIPTFAGLAITMTVLGSNLFGDWLRDALDPRTRQTLKQ
jgi:peptide/nickel transport system permease protein